MWNITRGTRLQTYAIKGQRGSGIICINGAAAHLNKPGDMVILATFAEFEEAEAREPRADGGPRRQGEQDRGQGRRRGGRAGATGDSMTVFLWRRS